VLRALLERELPDLVRRRGQLLEAAGSEPDVRAVAAVLVGPFAQMATGSRHERCVVRFLSRLNDEVMSDDADALIGDTGAHQAYELLRRLVPDIPEALLSERMQLGLNSFLHAAALRAGAGPQHVDDDTFRQNLVDMLAAALVAQGGCE
jgi:hypothetical protein